MFLGICVFICCPFAQGNSSGSGFNTKLPQGQVQMMGLLVREAEPALSVSLSKGEILVTAAPLSLNRVQSQFFPLPSSLQRG